ncbi:unnamed protein product [Paramecium pentaurelia]|uniref:Uncharacterized protein n=1 Tax=Paramecium pentaurelia TaxID=43138 RepID=A0A8S1YP73_9CILI|nr:unnamed protein product [Paramecium pentaurelia]
MVDQNYQKDVEKCIKQIRMVFIHNRGVFASQKSFCTVETLLLLSIKQNDSIIILQLITKSIIQFSLKPLQYRILESWFKLTEIQTYQIIWYEL